MAGTSRNDRGDAMTAAGAMTGERVIIVGGGGFGRELISHVTDCHEAGMMPAVGGYIDDTGETLARFNYDVPYLGSIDEYRPGSDDLLIMAIASPAGKRAVSAALIERGGRFTTMVHPSCVPSRNAAIGEGTVICTHAGPGVDTTIGRFVTINSYSALGHDANVGDFTTISGHVDITGNALIGTDVFIGSTASILPRVRIGDGASVGAGSVVYRSVSAGATVYAAPAKLLKRR